MRWIVWKELRGDWVNVGIVVAETKPSAQSRAKIFGKGVHVQSQLSHDADRGLYEKLCREAVPVPTS